MGTAKRRSSRTGSTCSPAIAVISIAARRSERLAIRSRDSGSELASPILHRGILSRILLHEYPLSHDYIHDQPLSTFQRGAYGRLRVTRFRPFATWNEVSALKRGDPATQVGRIFATCLRRRSRKV